MNTGSCLGGLCVSPELELKSCKMLMLIRHVCPKPSISTSTSTSTSISMSPLKEPYLHPLVEPPQIDSRCADIIKPVSGLAP